MTPTPGLLSRYAKAIGSGVGHAIVYLLGVMTSEQSFADLSTVQWLGAVLAFMVGAGIVAALPKGDELARLGRDGAVHAGPAAAQTTGVRLDPAQSVGNLRPAA